jgi:hypothetical protein
MPDEADNVARLTGRILLTAAWIGVAITVAIFAFGSDHRRVRYDIIVPAIAFPILVAIVVARVRHWWGTLVLAIASALLGAFTIYLFLLAALIHDRRAGLWISLVILGFGAVSVGSFVHIVSVRRANRERESG